MRYRLRNFCNASRPLAERRALVIIGQEWNMLVRRPDDLHNDLTALAAPAPAPRRPRLFVDGPLFLFFFFSNGQLPPKIPFAEIRIHSNPFPAEFDRSVMDASRSDPNRHRNFTARCSTIPTRRASTHASVCDLEAVVPDQQVHATRGQSTEDFSGFLGFK